MPHVTVIMTNLGPLLPVLVGPSVQRQAALKAAGQIIPAHVNCNFLIDTGASSTVIDSSIIAALKITPTGSVTVHTPTTGTAPQQRDLYDVGMIIMSGTGTPKGFPALPVIESSLKSQGIDGLLGRDVLAHSRLIYSGPDNAVMLSIF